jgi:outer membrane protein OmpA-like peptidoglycan-associated protein
MMKVFTYLLLVIVLGMGGYGTFFYLTEFKPIDEKIDNLKRENRTLTELVTKLKEEMRNKIDVETGDSYKKSVLGMLSRISTQENFEIRRAEKGVEISLPGVRLFNPGEAKLSDEGLLLLSKLGKILKNATTGEMMVEGHTDDTKISGELQATYPSNWELSAARAINVVKHLQDNVEIPPERLAAVAYGQYQPILPNDSETHRQKNRRIVIVLSVPEEEMPEEEEEVEEKPEVKPKEEKKEEKEGNIKIEKKPDEEKESGKIEIKKKEESPAEPKKEEEPEGEGPPPGSGQG